MLETRELVKVYTPKKGVPVTALDKVSLKFPEKGMVFLLGKSGSGKSTLLNVLGGLDNYNSGEIIIKGVSSKDFKQKHFDSYRNTYVGFIFQEYNVLEDFTVGANIALAIELQNRKAEDSEVNEILKAVDLEGFGARKPNELSGGQKQRVAIARALVKKPQIIMADEPTGALDSNTGKQIFDTLKRLSQEKLVIVVSHDRDFAEQYADRIIELSDGKVISDVELTSANAVNPTDKKLEFNNNVVEVPAGYHITEEDRKAINDYIDSIQNGGLKITVSNGAASSKKFVKTDESKIKIQDGSAFKLIKSKLPLKNAFKIGAGGLKHKKIRLVITILLSCVSFGLFGLADTFAAYNHIETCTNSLYDTGVRYIATGKSKKVGENINAYWRDYGYYLSDKDLAEIEKNTNVEMHGVYVPLGGELSFEKHIDTATELSQTNFQIFNTYFSGFAEVTAQTVDKMGFKILDGALPNGSKNEIAISEYIFEVFKRAKYTDGTLTKDENGKETVRYYEIKNYADIIGKVLEIDGVKYTVTAVIDTNFDLDRYKDLAVAKEHRTEAEQLVDYMLYSEFNTSSAYSYTGIVMTGQGFVDRLIENRPKMANITEGYISFHGNSYSADSNYLAQFSDVKNEEIIWVDTARTQLAEREIIVTTDALHFWEESETVADNEEQTADYIEKIKNENNLTASGYIFANLENIQVEGYKIVGIIETGEKTKLYSTVVCSDELYNKFTDGEDNYYKFAVGAAPKGKSNLERLVSYCYREDSNMRYQIQNSVTYELDAINEILQQLSKIFLYIGLGFAVFAALMLANFIGTSVSYKKQEIGILRAIGSRSNDVFRIFFAESFIIAMINFVLSATGVFAATAVINYIIRHNLGVLITVLSFDLRQIILLLTVSVAVAFVSSFLPVKKIAAKRPIDAIRNR